MIDDIELLKIIEKDPRIAPADIAVQLGAAAVYRNYTEIETVAKLIKQSSAENIGIVAVFIDINTRMTALKSFKSNGYLTTRFFFSLNRNGYTKISATCTGNGYCIVFLRVNVYHSFAF